MAGRVDHGTGRNSPTAGTAASNCRVSVRPQAPDFLQSRPPHTNPPAVLCVVGEGAPTSLSLSLGLFFCFPATRWLTTRRWLGESGARFYTGVESAFREAVAESTGAREIGRSVCFG
jgi:hypothetical protein